VCTILFAKDRFNYSAGFVSSVSRLIGDNQRSNPFVILVYSYATSEYQRFRAHLVGHIHLAHISGVKIGPFGNLESLCVVGEPVLKALLGLA
jgi:hypothetical protein